MTAPIRSTPRTTGRALALLLPAFVLAWPVPSLLAADLAPELTAAGIAALCAIPAALLTFLRPPARTPAGLGVLMVPVAIGAGWLALSFRLDTLEAERAYLTALAAVTLFVAAGALGEDGRRTLVRSATVLGLLLVAGGLVDADRAGPLGNTGDLAEAALPCAVLGAVLAAGLVDRETLGWRMCGAATAFGFAVWAATTPAITGALAFSTALLVTALAALRKRGEGVSRFKPAALLGAVAAIVVVTTFAFGTTGGVAAASGPDAAPEMLAEDGQKAADPGDLGGLEVRRRVWSGTLALVGDHPWVGVGPGQFARAFPPYRDPLEIERSTLGRGLSGETEVEHPHNDWLAPFAELGALGGTAWCAFLLWVLVAAWRALRTGDGARVALAAAAVAVLADGVAHAPFSDNAAASSVAFGMLGALLARDPVRDTDPRRAVRLSAVTTRLVPVAALALLVLAAGDARSVVTHGRTLAELARIERRWETATVEARSKRALKTVGEALEARADSALAHTLRARLSALSGADAEEVLDAWTRVLELRPHRFEALVQVGNHHARTGDTREARAFYDHALELDANHPGLLENFVRLEFLEGRIEHGLTALDRLAERKPVDAAWLERFGAELLLRGKDREGFVLFERSGMLTGTPFPEELWALSKELRGADREAIADAFEAQAHREWARRHAANERFHDAVRSYRQCLRLTRIFSEEGALRVRMELAAAALLDGDEDEARRQLQGERPVAADWVALPSWAGERLLSSGWFDA